MDLKNLTTFLHVAELSSFTRAGAVLGYSQSTVSFQIKQLETELGFALFERVNHTVALTEKGRQVLAYAHQVSRLTAQFRDSIQKEAPLSGRIRLAMSDSLCNSLLADRFCAFRERYPGIALKIIAAGTQEMFRLLDHNEVDAVMTLDSHIYHAGYVIVREEKVDTHFVAAPSHPLAGREALRVEELVRQPFVLTEKGMSYRRLLDEKLAQRSLEIRPVLELGDAHLICDLVEQGVGISFLPDFVTKKAVERGGLCHLPVRDFTVDIWKQLLHHRDKWISPQLDSVLQYCVDKEFTKLPAPCVAAAPE